MPLPWIEWLLGWVPDWILIALVLAAAFIASVLALNEKGRSHSRGRISTAAYVVILVATLLGWIGLGVFYYWKGDFWEATGWLIEAVNWLALGLGMLVIALCVFAALLRRF